MEIEKYRMMSVTDLLAIVLGKETKEVEKGADMLFEPKGLYCSVSELSDKTNLSNSNVKKLLAVAELIKRKNTNPKQKVKVESSNDVYEYVREDFEGLDHEELFVLFLNKANYVIQQVRFSVGSYDATMFDVRQIMRKALELKATRMVLQHNHPSGVLKPSTNDDSITKTLYLAGKCMGIVLLDHIILGHKDYYSYINDERLEKII